MILVVNNKEIDWENPQSDNERYVAKRIKWIRENKKRIRFEKVFTSKIDDGTIIMRPPTTFDCIAFKENDKTGAREKWILSDEGKVLNNGEKIYPVKRLSARLDIDIRVKDDPVMAFFFYDVFQRGVGHVGFRLKDEDKEAELIVETEALEAEASNYIYNKLSEPEIDLRCNAYGVSIEDKGLSRKKLDLFRRIKVLHKDESHTLTLQKFIAEALEVSDELKTSAYVNSAFNDKIIYMDNMIARYRAGNQILCNVPVQRLAHYEEYITEWLLSHDQEREAFLNSLGGSSVETIAENIVDWENVTNIQAIKKIARDNFGLAYEDLPAKITVDEVKNMIREKIVSSK